MVKKYNFYKTKYGRELLVDLIPLKKLGKYINREEPHYLTYFDITIVTHGYGHLLIDDFKCPIESNTLIFSSPGQIRNWNCNIIPKGFVLIFEEEFLSSFFNDVAFVQKLSYFNKADLIPYAKISATDFLFLNNLINELDEEIRTDLSKENHMLRALLYQILIFIERKYCTNYGKLNRMDSKNHVSDFINLVNAEFNKTRSVNSYAEKLNITPGHLNDIIKKKLKITAKEFILSRIMLEAKRLLNYSDLTISEIALKLNYQDLSYFIRSFKKLTGLTPLQFRRKQP